MTSGVQDERLDQARAKVRDAKWRYEVIGHALSVAVSQLQGWQRLLDFLGLAVAIAFLYAQYELKIHGSQLHDAVSIAGSVASTALIIVSIWALVSRWRSQVETKQDLASKLRKKISALDGKLRTVRQPDRLERFAERDADLEKELEGELARRWAAHNRAGFQHVAKKYPDAGVCCNVCSTTWSREVIRSLRWKRFIPSVFRCRYCGG